MTPPLNTGPGDQSNMAVFFWHLVQSDYTLLYTCTLGKTIFPRYQKNTNMFTWSVQKFTLSVIKVQMISTRPRLAGLVAADAVAGADLGGQLLETPTGDCADH